MSHATNHSRKKQFIDRMVQGSVLMHLIGHWLLFLLTVGLFTLFVEMLASPPGEALENLVRRQGPTVLAIVVLGPIFLRDICKLTNRFAGPMVRLRRGMHELAEGRDVKPIHFRKHDFWQDLATDFNSVIERMEALKKDRPDASSVCDWPAVEHPGAGESHEGESNEGLTCDETSQA